MSEEEKKLSFLGKILIKGDMEVCTGLHIGTSKDSVKIGGIDLPVVRDPLTNQPYVPGSSLKGKMRSLLEKMFEKNLVNISKKPDIDIHVCSNVDCEICRLFGSSIKITKNEQKHIPSRLIVRDLHLKNAEQLKNIEGGLLYTECKFENVIDRVSSAANPRQIERVPAGAEFEYELIYDAEKKDQLEEDLNNIEKALELLTLDALGGHGSRGSGKVKFKNQKYTGYPKQYYISGDKSLILNDKNPNEIQEIISAFVGEKNAYEI